MGLLNITPIFPLYYNGKTKFMPLHCSELCRIICHFVENDTDHKIIECIGPEILSFKEIIIKLLNLIDKKRILLPIPLPIANTIATFFQLLPKPLITKDQIKLLNFDNIATGQNITNIDINLKSDLIFEKEVEKYCYMWKDTGEYSKKI